MQTDITNHIKRDRNLRIESVSLDEDSFNDFFESVIQNARAEEDAFQKRMRSYHLYDGNKVIPLSPHNCIRWKNLSKRRCKQDLWR